MFFNNAMAMKKAAQIIQEEKHKAERRKIRETSQNSREINSTNRNLKTKEMLHPIKSGLRSPQKKRTASFAEQKAYEALNRIEKTIENQEERENRLEKNIKDTMIEAKNKLADGKKRAAIRSMKKVKLEQVELNKVSAVIETLETQKLHIESSLNSIKVLKVMQEGSSTLQELNSSSNIEDIENVVDGIRDANEITTEINEILSAPVDSILIDDDDLLKELEEYRVEDNLNLQSAPTKPLVLQNQQVDHDQRSNSGEVIHP